MQPINLKPNELEIVRAILAAHVPDRKVWAFGSRVTGTDKEFADLDLTILGEEPLPAAVAADLAEAFSESDLPFKVDVVDWATTGDSFRRIIEKNHLVLQKP